MKVVLPCSTSVGVHSSLIPLFPEMKEPRSPLSSVQSRAVFSVFQDLTLCGGEVFTSIIHFPCVPKPHSLYHKGIKVVSLHVCLPF